MKIRDKLGLKIHKEYFPKLEKISEVNKEELGKRLIATLFDKEPKEGFPPLHKPNAEDIFFRDLFHHHGEVIECFENFNLLLELVAKFPSSFKKISKLRYLRFIYESFLNEVYIYEQRIIGMIKMLQKRSQKARLQAEYKKLILIESRVRKAFADADKRRGKHVHVRRHTTKKIERLTMFEVLNDMEPVNTYGKIVINQHRKEYRDEISTATNQLFDILDLHLSKELDGIIFDKLIPHYRSLAKSAV